MIYDTNNLSAKDYYSFSSADTRMGVGIVDATNAVLADVKQESPELARELQELLRDLSDEAAELGELQSQNEWTRSVRSHFGGHSAALLRKIAQVVGTDILIGDEANWLNIDTVDKDKPVIQYFDADIQNTKKTLLHRIEAFVQKIEGASLPNRQDVKHLLYHIAAIMLRRGAESYNVPATDVHRRVALVEEDNVVQLREILGTQFHQYRKAENARSSGAFTHRMSRKK